MCNMTMIPSRLPAFVEDPALSPLSAKPLSLPTLRVAPATERRQQLSSERFARRPSGVSFENEAFRLRTQANISELVRTAATSEECSSTNALLAKKALKYRRVLERCSFTGAGTAVSC
jgi:hypothetical protein